MGVAGDHPDFKDPNAIGRSSVSKEMGIWPIDDRLDWENVAHIHHGILCSNQKQ